MQSFITAAESAGLGTCPISQIRNRIDEACELLGLPAGVFPIAGLAVGWPKFETPRMSLRLPQTVVVHTDKYDESNMPVDVESYDRRRHEHTPLPDLLVTNIAFVGDEPRAVCTLSGTGQLVEIDWPRPGLALAHSA